MHTTIFYCVSISNLNLDRYSKHLLVSKYPLRLHHQRAGCGINSGHQRASLAVHGWNRETKWDLSKMHRWRRRSCPPPRAANDNRHRKSDSINKNGIIGLDTSAHFPGISCQATFIQSLRDNATRPERLLAPRF